MTLSVVKVADTRLNGTKLYNFKFYYSFFREGRAKKKNTVQFSTKVGEKVTKDCEHTIGCSCYDQVTQRKLNKLVEGQWISKINYTSEISECGQ